MTKTYTSNGNDSGTGIYTGYNITVNVPDTVPICDRVVATMETSQTVLLSSFLVGTGQSVAVPADKCLVVIIPYDTYRHVTVYSRTGSFSVVVISGALYYIFDTAGSIITFRNYTTAFL